MSDKEAEEAIDKINKAKTIIGQGDWLYKKSKYKKSYDIYKEALQALE